MAGQSASLAAALRAGEEVFREALQKAPTLPKLADVGRAPATLADAILAVEERQRRQDALRRDVKPKGKQFTPLTLSAEPPPPTPGLAIGSANEASAFWLFVEDYFRDVTQEDIMALLPVALSPEEDDCLTVPFLGRDPRGGDQPAHAKLAGKQDEEGTEKRGRGRGGGKVDMRAQELPVAPDAEGQQLFPQSQFTQPQASADALVQGWRPDGRGAANMLEACTYEEARALCALAHKLGLLEEAQTEAADAMDRPGLDQLLLKVSQLGAAADTDGGLPSKPSVAEGGEGGVSGPRPSSDGSKPVPARAVQAGEEDTLSSNKGPGHELPRAACGDFMHPYLRRVLERPCTAYVLNPCAGTGSLLDAANDDEEAGPAGGAAGGGRGRGSQAALAYTAKTPAAGKAALKMQASSLQDSRVSPMPDAGSGAGPMTQAAPTTSQQQDPGELQQQPLVPQQQQQLQPAEDSSVGGAAAASLATTPTFGGPGLPCDKALGGASGPRGGRARNTVNYSALAGKKDKEREREMREREKEERDRAKSAAPKYKRKPGPKAGASWNAGAPGGLAGLQKPPTNNPLALLNKVPLLFKEDPMSNATTAAVHAVVAEGGAEGDMDQQWAQLDAATDIMSMAPDDEIQAELIALQTELAQQVAINRSRAAAVMDAVMADIPAQRAANQQRAEWEDQIRSYLQRKVEVKRNIKREKKEMEKRQALAALNEPASPRGLAGRPKKFAGMQMGSFDGMGMAMSEGMEGAEGWQGDTPGLSGGEGVPMEPLPMDDANLVDPLAVRTQEEEALCAICGDGMSVDPNMIVFCERCDIAVHQHCYGVRSIPADEWLCWPCRFYEEQQRAQGVPQNEIRPKRWEMEARGITHAELPGGSHAVPCCLCPVRHGAFKRTTDGRSWCHVVCGMWHEGPQVLPVDSPDAIDGLGAIKPDRFRSPCALCQKVAGAVVKCNFGHCQAFFHPLCGRRAGNYLVARVQPGSRQLRYRAYCHNHSEGQRAKDMQTGAAARVAEVLPVLNAMSSKPGRRGAGAASMGMEGMADVGGAYEAGMAPMDGLGAQEMQLMDQDAAAAAAAAAGAPALPVKKRFGRPPKLLKQQQLLQLQLASNPACLVGTPPELQPGMPLPSPAMPEGASGLEPVQLQAQEGATGMGLGAAGLGSPLVALPSGASAGRPPLPGSRLSLTAAARRKAAAAAAAGGGMPGAHDSAFAGAAAAAGGPGAAGGYEQAGGFRADGGAKARMPGRATPSSSLQQAAFGAAGMGAEFGDAAASDTAATGGRPGQKAGPGRPRQSSSSAGPMAAGAAGAATASSGLKQQRLRGIVKEEPADGETGATGTSLSPASAAAVSAAAARARSAAAAASAAALRSRGGVASGRAPATLERLADLEHQKSMLGRWWPNSVRNELELLRTMADTVRRRERAKRAQYRLLRDALAAQETQPEAVLAFLEDWEWPATDGTNPFSAEDNAPAPVDTVLDRLLQAATKPAGAGAVPATGAAPSTGAAGTPAAAAAAAAAAPAPTPPTTGPSAAGISGGTGGTKRQRAAAEAAAAAGAAAASSGAVASGGEQPPTKRIRLKKGPPAEALETPRPAPRAGKPAGRTASGGGGGGAASGPASSSQPAGQGADASGEVGSKEEQHPGSTGAKRARGSSGPAKGTGGKEPKQQTIKEIMSGRDWRRRVVMGPDGKWVPRPPGVKGAAKGAGGRGSGSGGAPGPSSDAAGSGGAGGEATGAESAGHADRDGRAVAAPEAGQELHEDEDVFEDAEERFAEAEGKGGDEHMEDAARGAAGDAAAAAAAGKEADKSGAEDGVGAGGDGGDEGRGGTPADGPAGGTEGGDAAGAAEESRPACDGSAAEADGQQAREGSSPKDGRPAAASASPGRDDVGRGLDVEMADPSADVPAEAGAACEAGPDGDQPPGPAGAEPPALAAPTDGEAAAGAGAAGTPGAASDEDETVTVTADPDAEDETADQVQSADPDDGQQQQQQQEQQPEQGEQQPERLPEQAPQDAQEGVERAKSAEGASTVVLTGPAELPREPRAVMSQSTADALNAKLPKGYRFEKET